MNNTTLNKISGGLTPLTGADYPALLVLWEASVRASHHFLPEAAIVALRQPLLDEYFPAVTLTGWRSPAGKVEGFIGVAAGHIEMLFVAPEAQGAGIGSALLAHAVNADGATGVDVNQQNPAALAFYQRHGFKIIGESPTDGQGEPYPLWHLALSDADATARD